MRVTRTITSSWTASCDLDDCGAQQLDIPLEMPVVSGTANAVLSLTLDYRSTTGDALGVAAGYRLEEGTKPIPMRPGEFRLQSPSPQTRTTSTLTWVANGLEGGREYTFVGRMVDQKR